MKNELWQISRHIIVIALDQRKDVAVNATDGVGKTALMYAIKNNQIDIVALLLQFDDILVDIKDEPDKTAWIDSLQYNCDPKCIQLILDHSNTGIEEVLIVLAEECNKYIPEVYKEKVIIFLSKQHQYQVEWLQQSQYWPADNFAVGSMYCN